MRAGLDPPIAWPRPSSVRPGIGSRQVVTWPTIGSRCNPGPQASCTMAGGTTTGVTKRPRCSTYDSTSLGSAGARRAQLAPCHQRAPGRRSRPGAGEGAAPRARWACRPRAGGPAAPRGRCRDPRCARGSQPAGGRSAPLGDARGLQSRHTPQDPRKHPDGRQGMLHRLADSQERLVRAPVQHPSGQDGDVTRAALRSPREAATGRSSAWTVTLGTRCVVGGRQRHPTPHPSGHPIRLQGLGLDQDPGPTCGEVTNGTVRREAWRAVGASGLHEASLHTGRPRPR